MAQNFSELNIQKQKSFYFTLAITLHLIIRVPLSTRNFSQLQIQERHLIQTSFFFISASKKCALMFHASWIYLHISNKSIRSPSKQVSHIPSLFIIQVRLMPMHSVPYVPKVMWNKANLSLHHPGLSPVTTCPDLKILLIIFKACFIPLIIYMIVNPI